MSSRYEEFTVNKLKVGGDTIAIMEDGENFTLSADVDNQKWHEISAVKKYALGTRLVVRDRVFRYSQNAAVALVAGNLIQSAALGGATTTVQTEIAAGTASAAGNYYAYATISTTDQAANVFEDGYYLTTKTSSTGLLGYCYKIKSHAAIAGSAIGKFMLYEPLVAPVAAATEVCLVGNLYKNVIACPVTTPTGMVVGVAPRAITASYYFWLQTWGPTCILDANTVTASGQELIRNVTTAGSVKPQVAGSGSLITENVGYSLVACTVSEGTFAFLTIAP